MSKPKKWKRKKPTSARGHCKMCKNWKINGLSRLSEGFEKFSDHKRRIFAERDSNLPS